MSARNNVNCQAVFHGFLRKWSACTGSQEKKQHIIQTVLQVPQTINQLLPPPAAPTHPKFVHVKTKAIYIQTPFKVCIYLRQISVRIMQVRERERESECVCVCVWGGGGGCSQVYMCSHATYRHTSICECVNVNAVVWRCSQGALISMPTAQAREIPSHKPAAAQEESCIRDGANQHDCLQQ